MPATTDTTPFVPNGVAHPLKLAGGQRVIAAPKMRPTPMPKPQPKPQPKPILINGAELGHGTHHGVNCTVDNDRGPPDIIDIRRAEVELNLKTEIVSSFLTKPGQRALPTMLLYDQCGLQIFEEITYLEEYYLTNDEISVLETSSAEIAAAIPDGSMVVELGSGNLRKVNLLLQALDDAGKDVDYYALDLSRAELDRTLAQVPPYRHIRCHGLLGTYDDGREWLEEPANLGRQKCVMSLGSSIGNFRRNEASGFLKGFSSVLRPGDSMILGVDACYDPVKVYRAYNDSQGITNQFLLNGLVNANKILGHEAFKVDDWRVIGEYIYDTEGGRHQAWFCPIRDTWALGEMINAGERVLVECSVKYDESEIMLLWQGAEMVEAARWSVGNEYGVHLLSKPTMPFALTPSEYASTPLPTIDDWTALWATWDTVSRGMMPKKELLEKPIRLRNACIFYLGHIPTFLDIQLTKTTKEPATEPKEFARIFERGVDPDVDNPELCHTHSEIPDEWPQVGEIAEYQERVRSRVRNMYSSRVENIPRNVARAIWVGFEHEVMHIETFLYMLLQSDRTLPPPGSPVPDFEGIARRAKAGRVRNEWFFIPATEVTIGLNDPEDGTDLDRHFGWDNEKPERKVIVGAFEAKARPITNEEYAKYMHESGLEKAPASWVTTNVDVKTNGSKRATTNVDVKTNGSKNGNENASNGNGHKTHTNGHANGHCNGSVNGHTNGSCSVGDDGLGDELPGSFLAGKAVRTVYGPVPLRFALDWPVFASYDELAGCASWMGGRIPNLEETKNIYQHAEMLRREAQQQLTRTVPAVNGHLCNNGVEESPPSRGTDKVDGEGIATNPAADDERFIDLAGANVGFQHWHPTPVTADGGRLAGQGQMGGVWEWTSSTLRRHDGFEPMTLYPNYTADFFDEKHNIVLGGSWATHPRIAGRKTFVNWYQRNYPYAWAGARLVRDASD